MCLRLCSFFDVVTFPVRVGIKLPRHIVATADPASALKDATYIIHAVPVQYTRKFLENVRYFWNGLHGGRYSLLVAQEF